MIKIIGLGPGAPEALTIGTIEALKNIDKVYLRTEKHPTVQYIESLGVKFETYDNAYDNFDTFDEVYNFIAEDLINKHEKEGDLIYAVPGHPCGRKVCKAFGRTVQGKILILRLYLQ